MVRPKPDQPDQRRRLCNSKLPICPITLTVGYQMDCTINGVLTPFLLDTGAAVSLLWKDTWERVNTQPAEPTDLFGSAASGVDGSPLTVYGSATVDLRLHEHSMTTDVIVVSLLTAEVILGLDFLREHCAHNDLPNQQLYLANRGISLYTLASSIAFTGSDRQDCCSSC